MKEEWKDVPGYEGLYQISSIGRVKSVYRLVYNGHMDIPKPESILKPNVLAKGYLQVTLYKEKSRKCFQVHRLVAMAFIPNPKNYPQINHINGNKQDNMAQNLEWCTNRVNQLHAWKMGLQKPHYCGGGAPKKRVAMLDSKGNVEMEFESIRAASRYIGCSSPANISHLLNGRGRIKSVYGKRFVFV